MKIFNILLCCLVCFDASASIWSKNITVDYHLGDGDSKSTARELALEQIKLKGSSEAGTYVQNTTTLNNDNLSEHIQVISASMISLSNIKEDLLTQDKSFILRVSAVTTIDEVELASRIKAIQTDKAKAKQIAKLEVENQILVTELVKVKSLLSKDNLNTQQVASILKRQTNLIQNFKSNTNAITQVFSKGTLLQIARKNKGKLNQAISQLETEFFGPLLETKINIDVDVIEENGKYIALVNVDWSAPSSINYSTLRKNLHSYDFNSKRGYVSFSSYKNTGTDAKVSLTESLFAYLSKQTVMVEIQIGTKTIALPMFWSESYDSFDTCEGYDNYGKFSMEYGRICFLEKQSANDDLRVIEVKDNPIKITLTAKEVQSITSIKATVRRI